MNEIKSSREIELGMRRYDKLRDPPEIFQESERLIMPDH